MRRAVAVLLLLAALPLSAIAVKPGGSVDAIGMIDYVRGHHFKVGDWAKYQVTGSNAQGYTTDYTVTVLIAGEERWWGEECFWFETHTAYGAGPPDVTASLLSYAVFEDSVPSRHFSRYLRKYFDGFDEKGNAVQQLFMRNPMEYITRGYDYWEPARQRDTVGVEKVQVPKGTLQALRVNQDYKGSLTKQEGDSTIFLELSEKHTRWQSDEVPITSLVRMEEENTERRRAWKVGESANAPLLISQRSLAITALVDFGKGMKSTLVADRFQRPLSEQGTSPAKRRPSPPASRTTRTRG